MKSLASLVVALAMAGVALAQSVDVLRSTDPTHTQSLDGIWAFKYLPGSDAVADERFPQSDFDDNAWARTPVPSHWELHGFAEPKYKKVDAGLGLYRRAFRVPSTWKGGRVLLRFDGVLYGFQVWVNGRAVGEWASSYNPVTFDITDAVHRETENILAVRVTTRSKGWEFDTNDCWALSGIYREVSLLHVPDSHLIDYTARTSLRADGAAEFHLAVATTGAGTVTAHLKRPDGQRENTVTIPTRADGRGDAAITLPHPQLWTAETPALYGLEMEFATTAAGAPHRVSERIGLREVAIVDGVLQLNGRPIKLRGINHHDIWPDEGRVATEALLRRDLEMMRAANVNFIRTSHYPPHPRLIELCDEMGLYVMCEVPFGFGDKNLTDPTFESVLRTRARATVMRDKNRPSVIVWSIGNENPLTELGTKTALYTKQIDPTRPVCFPTVGSYFRNNFEKFVALPPEVDVYAPHYGGVERLRDYAATLRRPIIATEYSHALGLAFDSFQDIWEFMYQNPHTAGGAVWMFQDQGLRRDARVTGSPEKGALYVWPDATHYFDTAGTDGCDGIVYSDRTPQIDYWQVRKVYAPVHISERRIEVTPGAQVIRLLVENRHDFRPLTGMSLAWSLRVNGATLQSGAVALSAAPHAREKVEIPLTLPADCATSICTLEVSALDEARRSIVERSIRLETQGASAAKTLLASLSSAGALTVKREPDAVEIANERFSMRVRSDTGEIELRRGSGALLATGFLPHVSRRFTMAEELRVSRPSSQAAAELELRTGASSIWRDAVLRPAARVAVEVREAGGGVRVVVQGRYARSEAPDQFLTGEIVLELTSAGAIAVSYSFTPVNAKGQLLEAGLSVVVPDAATQFRWLGDGPYPGYPGKDALNEPGLHHLASGDLRFRGNRRQVELALLTRANGAGVLLAGAGMDVAVESGAGLTLLSHNAMVSGLGNKGGSPESRLEIERLKSIAGRFTVVPLDGDWPAQLVAWFGKPDDAAKVWQPFLRSYDQ